MYILYRYLDEQTVHVIPQTVKGATALMIHAHTMMIQVYTNVSAEQVESARELAAKLNLQVIEHDRPIPEESVSALIEALDPGPLLRGAAFMTTGEEAA